MIASELSSKIMTWDEALTWRLQLKSQNKKLVFTNGCFDLLHPGHVNYLTQARSLGDALIVAINSDESVQRLGKSPNRPLQTEIARGIIMAGLQCTDAVIVFGEDTPLEIIQKLMPDVLVKGADYEIENIVGAKEVLANGGEVKTLTFLEGYSTTAIEKKILNSANS